MAAVAATFIDDEAEFDGEASEADESVASETSADRDFIDDEEEAVDRELYRTVNARLCKVAAGDAVSGRRRRRVELRRVLRRRKLLREHSDPTAQGVVRCPKAAGGAGQQRRRNGRQRRRVLVQGQTASASALSLPPRVKLPTYTTFGVPMTCIGSLWLTGG